MTVNRPISVPATATIEAVRRLTGDTALYRLRLEEQRCFSFSPGQFIQLSVPAGGEVPISLAGTPGDSHLELCVRRAGHVTNLLHCLSADAKVAVRGPFGNGFPVEKWKGKDVLMLAGGLGMAPLRSLLRYLLERRREYGEITLMYGARRTDLLLFREELAVLSCRKDLKLFLTVDFLEGEAAEGLACRKGLVTDILSGIRFLRRDAVAAVCGPPPLYRCVIGELQQAGIEEENIHLSLERRMKCGIGLCCHCGVGDQFCCSDGPVFTWLQLRHIEGAL
ncbi:FAD/NAD(P)-binding protein [Geobacter sp. DSM 9736]|uniref:FAD/NAD(P)-binding protein n=1 Tax=Geobacter sp. DSM 9736 TaxID=1277350 RepID=UPI000B504609|nr:FAD/NAD(P)-binding protein [Geobacter sp. DSM 9736]SNB46024.1 NAD(P)H-flavin reductase [Geobacter sp. DSM 9736]